MERDVACVPPVRHRLVENAPDDRAHGVDAVAAGVDPHACTVVLAHVVREKLRVEPDVARRPDQVVLERGQPVDRVAVPVDYLDQGIHSREVGHDRGETVEERHLDAVVRGRPQDERFGRHARLEFYPAGGVRHPRPGLVVLANISPLAGQRLEVVCQYVQDRRRVMERTRLSIGEVR